MQFGLDILSKKSNETMPSHNMADLVRCFISNWDIITYFFFSENQIEEINDYNLSFPRLMT